MDGGGKKDGVGGGLVCAHCKKAAGLGTMKCCGRCKRVNYCSVECQKGHWKLGGHKNVCGKESGGGARGDGAGDAPLQNPCPVCRDNEDDHGKHGMCYSCGQMYCGKCRETLRIGSLDTCPTCRAVIAVTEQENVRRLRRLLERPRGRYTPAAQNNLGVCYANGTGVNKDPAEAVRLYRLAADQGMADAQYNLGWYYENTTGVGQDHDEAVRWYRLAANQGYANAQHTLGNCYLQGIGASRGSAKAAGQPPPAADYAEAVRLYRLAADQGHADARRTLDSILQWEQSQ
jgi:TPR repeat protein